MTPRQYDIVGIGMSYVDQIFSGITISVLEKLGVPVGGGLQAGPAQLDAICGQLGSHVTSAGGAAANALSVVTSLGLRVGYFGKVGDDDFGRLFTADLATRNITALCGITVEDGRTARCLVLCLPPPSGDRSFVYFNGETDKFSPDDFMSFDFSRSKFVLIEGLLFQSASAEVVNALVSRIAGLTNIIVTLHGTHDWSDSYSVASNIANHAAVICGTADEQQDFWHSLSDKPRGLRSHIVVTTLGSSGAVLHQGATELRAVPTPIAPTQIVNTVGAGDAFLGGFATALVWQWPLDKALRFAVAIASESLKSVGARVRDDLSLRALSALDNRNAGGME